MVKKYKGTIKLVESLTFEEMIIRRVVIGEVDNDLDTKIIILIFQCIAIYFNA